ncbi:MAG TPA: type II toxin-antitoxin system HicB family antitoxin [Longimicrobiaceae bacterium]|nr:type II toxin-antitoxin system HicB family antitoxin [Longimicrobiaceae bacterium]
MSIKEQAVLLIDALPDNCTWNDVLHAISNGAAASAQPGMVRELRVAYGDRPTTRIGEEEGMSYDFDVIVERDDEGWYVGSVPALAGCHTQARSVDQLMERVREAAELCLEASGGQPSGTVFVGVRRVSVNR